MTIQEMIENVGYFEIEHEDSLAGFVDASGKVVKETKRTVVVIWISPIEANA